MHTFKSHIGYVFLVSGNTKTYAREHVNNRDIVIKGSLP